MILTLLILLSCSHDSSSIHQSESNVYDTSNDQDQQTYVSENTFTETVVYTYDQTQTIGNPLQGFVTNYAWGEPNNSFPDSMEFRYVPLSELLSAPDTYTYNTTLEPYLEEAKERGHQVILRVYIDYPALESGLPSFLQDEVECLSYVEHGGGCSPEYANELLQSTLLDFITHFGNAYDGDNRLAFVQVGLLGFWGEWHTYPHSDWFAEDTFQQQVITTFDTAFETTPIQMRLPYQDSAQRKIGFHDDSFAYSTIGDVPWFFWSKMTDAQATTRWQEAPMGGEVYPALQQTLFSAAYVEDVYQQAFDSTVQTTHMTYLLNYQAFCMNGIGYTGTQYQTAQQESLQMGYEYTISKALLHVSNVQGEMVQVQIEVHFRNSGIAPFYYPLILYIEKRNHDETFATISDIEELLPTVEDHVYITEAIDVPISELLNGYVIKLNSEHILDEAFISWANEEQAHGQLDVLYSQQCTVDDQYYSLGQEIQRGDTTCYCDVDGKLYTANHEICD
jgi:hypothetical protein